MAATRTQVYLTAEQRAGLDRLGRTEGKSMAELVREAINRLLAERPDVDEALAATFGAVPTIEVPDRGEWDRD